MKIRERKKNSSTTAVRVHARRVALGATVLALTLYVIACAVADFAAVSRIYSSTDARLAVRLEELVKENPGGLGAATPPTSPISGDDDIDDAPILAWYVPGNSGPAIRLNAGTSLLPANERRVTKPVDAKLGTGTFRLEGAPAGPGWLVVGTSTHDVANVRDTLLLIEMILAPVILFILFVAATIIGRRAAMPIERTRLRQLEFTADASHELRTPLAVIEAEIGLALSTDRNAAGYRAALERVAEESNRLRSIVEDLLWLARLDELPAKPSNDAVDLTGIARACAARFQAIAVRRDLTIAVSDAVKFPAIVIGPAEWFDRLLSVLIDNACRYADPNSRVEISVVSTEERVALVVDDSGPGIPEAERDQILERFHRASSLPGGAGLGLSIADAVVRATGGRCEITTAPLGGARISTSWPRSRSGDGYGDNSTGRSGSDLTNSPADAVMRGDAQPPRVDVDAVPYQVRDGDGGFM